MEFLPSTSIQTLPGTANSEPGLRCSLWEALGWTAGYLLSQVLVLSGLMALLLVSAFGLEWPPREQIIAWCLDLELDRSFLFVGASSLGTLFIMVPAIRWREGRRFRERLGWRTPNLTELTYALATIVPIALLGNVVYETGSHWHPWTWWPFAAALRESSLELLYTRFQGVPFPVLVVAMALGPAVGEELIFRGVLGRRLIGRFGVVTGIGLTSLCFAAAHVDPLHAISTLPIAMLLHVIYLRTGTIWMPILVHFGNNLLALTLVRFQVPTVQQVSPWVTAAMCLYLGVILFLLHIRTRRPETQPLGFANACVGT